jgi:hypothetical protein
MLRFLRAEHSFQQRSISFRGKRDLDVFSSRTYSDFASKLSASAFNFNIWRMFSMKACTFL